MSAFLIKGYFKQRIKLMYLEYLFYSYSCNILLRTDLITQADWTIHEKALGTNQLSGQDSEHDPDSAASAIDIASRDMQWIRLF